MASVSVVIPCRDEGEFIEDLLDAVRAQDLPPTETIVVDNGNPDPQDAHRMRTALTVSVVIPCRNESATIARLLEAIAGQDQLPDEVIVVDDASTDGTAEVVAAWRREKGKLEVRVVRGAGRGVAAAMNVGIRAAQSEIIVRLDGHCRPALDYIERSLDALTIPNAGVVGGAWAIEPGAPGLAAGGIAAVLSHPLGSGGADYRQPPRDGAKGPRSVDTVPFGTFRRDLWQRLGGFDESLIRNQDYDFNHRVRLTGLDVILDPAIVSVYKARSTFGSLARQYFDYGFWKVVMLRKFPASIRLRQLLPLLLVPALVGLIAWAFVARSWLPLALLAAYLALNLAGATQASLRAGDVRLILAATAALLTLQNAWSAGAWTSLLRGARAPQR